MQITLTKIFFYIFIIYCWGCGSNSDSGINNGFEHSKNVPTAVLLEGKKLAENRCQSCHTFPDPKLLDKDSWEHYVLPTMGYRMGLYHRIPGMGFGIRSSLIDAGLAGEIVLQANIFPEKPAILVADFQKITDYYLTAAPEKALPPAVKPSILPDLKLFEAHFPDLPFRPASTTFVKIDSANKLLLVGLAHQKTLLQLNNQGKIRQTWPQNTPVSDYLLRPEGNYALQIGSFFPSDAPTGSLTYYANNTNIPTIILNRLQRPVQALFADLNNDTYTDLLLCEFGNQTGSLSWYENKSGKTFQKHVLKNAPGAVRAYIQDLNNDKQPDIVALLAQGNEEIIIFYNKDHGRFQEKQVMHFPPSMGSSYFEMIDFNLDGHLDILYTAGDNADFKPVAKRYHGVRLFINNGRFKFKEVFFFPQNGAYKATAADFDGDGDLDIASIAFYPRFQENPQESFVYLENKGGFNFQASTFRGSHRGRWLTMDKGDLDGDGDTDIVLGSFVLPTKLATPGQYQNWAQDGPVVVILENKNR